ncbi:DUF1579 domain-containing protein [Xanthobacter sp. KR7-65]|uniref:DUF1579 domain-containing protein n=1 Tax=Xanthobacter sp. KR7-65 TaxID=3156612 RepID=UPI0032B4BD0F
MQAEPTDAHMWLKRLVGEWSVEAPSYDGEGTVKGTETVRTLGDLWVICEAHMEMPDGSAGKTVMTLGYDPQKGKIVGSWVGSMMTYLWVYEGSIDAAGACLTLDARGPTFDETGAFTDYQDIITFEGDDARVLRSRQRLPDGAWQDLFSARYSRSG